MTRFSDALLITQQAPQQPGAWAYWMPDPKALGPFAAWWSLSDDCLERMLNVLGYEVVSRIRAEHKCVARGDREMCTATVAERRIPRRV